MSIKDCKIIELPKFLDMRGNLSFVEQNNHIPFEIKRTYWIYDVPGGECRGSHAFRNTEEFIVALSGGFDVIVDDGERQNKFTLNRSYYGLYIPKGLWRRIDNFSTNSLALEFASTSYIPDDYIRNYDDYLQLRGMEKYSVFDCSMIELDKHHSDRKGNLTVVQNGDTLPFDVKRVYYLYDVPGGESRGAHAHRDLSQFMVAASGSFRVTLDDGKVKRSFFLNRPYQGLYVKPGIWRDLDDFSSGAVCMVLASDVYKKEDYIRNYDEFLEFREISNDTSVKRL